MKNLKLLFMTLLMAGLFFTSCKKNTDEPNPQVSLTVEDAESMANEIVDVEATFEDVDFLADEKLDGILNGPPPPGDCPLVTKDQPVGVFPVTITIDFGASCIGPKGKVRSGKIFITLSDKPMVAGATRTITFEDFVVDGKSVEGVRTRTNNGLDDQGRPSWTRSTVGGKITWPNGETRTWDATHTMLVIEGYDTPHYRKDDDLEFSGTRSVVRKDGTTISSTITTPLVKMHDCKWIVSGVQEMTRNGETATLDFGNGDCDMWGTLTLADGTTKQIKLKPWRHH